jgi:hypothetical protein
MRPLEYGDDAEYLLVPFPECPNEGPQGASRDKRRADAPIRASKSNTIDDRQQIPRGDNIRLLQVLLSRTCPRTGEASV